jgi:hypothetical protein
MTKLGNQIQRTAATAKAETQTPLGKYHALGERGAYAEIPKLGRVYVQLIGHATTNEIEAETWAEMERLRLPAVSVNVLTFDEEKAVRTLAAAIRDPDDATHAAPFGTVEEWRSIDRDLIAASVTAYNDVRVRLSPLDDDELTDADRIEIIAAIQKKNRMALRLCGVAKLSRFLLTSDVQHSISPTELSSFGLSSPE